MADQKTSTGELFSRVYLDRGTPTRESARFRNRLAAYCRDQFERDDRWAISTLIRRELGIIFSNDSYPEEWFVGVEVRDVVDTITLVWQYCYERGHRNAAESWHTFVQRVLREENLGYRLDERAGVHYYVDEEFERSRASALASLSAPQYAAVLSHFEATHQYLDDDDPRAAVRAAFDAVEVLMKQLAGAGKIKSLGASDVEKRLKPIVLPHYSDTARDAANQLLNGLADWINAIQPYRHGQKDPEPPMEVAIAMVSVGASYLRWLAEVDQKANA